MSKITGSAAFIAAIIVASSPALAFELSELAGKSIIATMDEQLKTPRGSIRIKWDERVYISAKGTIFNKIAVDGSVPAASGQGSLVSGEHAVAFKFDGTSLARSWINPKTGVRLYETITLNSTQVGAQCSYQISRSATNVQSVPLEQTCSVVAGNAVAE